MEIDATSQPALETAADTIVFGVFEGEATAPAALRALIDSGEAKRSHGAVALTHVDGRRLLLAGLGARDRFDAERARVSAAKVAGRASELGARHLCWRLPDAATRLSPRPWSRARCWRPTASTVTARRPRTRSSARRRSPPCSERRGRDRRRRSRRATSSPPPPTTRARSQDTPANDLSPGDLAARAAGHGHALTGLTVTVERRAEIAAAAWARSPPWPRARRPIRR